MSRVLLDTNVLFETVRVRPDPQVLSFLRTLREPLISAITLQELTFGAERTADPVRRARLVAWIDRIRTEYADRIVPVDAEVAVLAGRLRAAAGPGVATDPSDAMIAACAASRAAVVATRNTRDFEPFGLDIVDPWANA